MAEEQYNVFIAPLFFTTEELPIPACCMTTVLQTAVVMSDSAADEVAGMVA